MQPRNLIELFRRLCEIDSVSGEEENISLLIRKIFKEKNIDLKSDRLNQLFLPVDQPDSILFCAHQDTVEPGKGIEVEEADGYFKSKGDTILGADNKAALAAIITAYFDVYEKSPEKLNNIELLFTVREETDSGASKFDYDQLSSTRGFVFDKSGGDLALCVRSAPTIYDFIIELIGKSAHSTNQSKAANPLLVLTSFIDDFGLGSISETTNLNFGVIKGGNATNSSPDELIIAGDLRCYGTTDDFEKFKHKFQKTLDFHASKLGVDVKYHWQPYCNGYRIDKKNRHLEFTSSIYKSHGYDLELIDTTSGSDASALNYNGIETLCLGDGTENVHSTDEKISKNNLIKLYEIVKDLMLNY
jgi:tripeptide aminopeptidase